MLPSGDKGTHLKFRILGTAVAYQYRRQSVDQHQFASEGCFADPVQPARVGAKTKLTEQLVTTRCDDSRITMCRQLVSDAFDLSPPPNDPLAEARSKMIESQGRSAFNDYFLPEAAVALKQGAGCLIRRETDQGVLVVCDSRLVSMGYGRRLLRALPAMQRLNSEQELMDRLAGLTRTCTTGCPQT